MIIAYLSEDQKIRLVLPCVDCELPVEIIAKKDVPANIPYRIVNDDFFADQSESPIDDWLIDMSSPDGEGSSLYGTDAEWSVSGFSIGPNGILLHLSKYDENKNILTKDELVL